MYILQLLCLLFLLPKNAMNFSNLYILFSTFLSRNKRYSVIKCIYLLQCFSIAVNIMILYPITIVTSIGVLEYQRIKNTIKKLKNDWCFFVEMQ